MRKIRHISTTQSFADWFSDLWTRHETLYFLVWKDLKVQYGNFFVGVLWSIFQPLLYFALILAVHRWPLGSSLNDAPLFPVVLFIGIVVWNFFTNAVIGVVASIQANASTISRSFFPRFYLVLAPIVRSCIDMLFSMLVIVGMIIYFQLQLSLVALWAIPLGLALLILTALGVGALAAVAVVRNRHFRQVIPVLLYAGLFFLPVFHSFDHVGNGFLAHLYTANPLATAIHVLRHGVGVEHAGQMNLIWPISYSIALVVLGVYSFRRLERTLADRI